MPVKEILFALLSFALPIVYSWIVGKYPDFPQNPEQFISLVLWLVGLIVGGWQVAIFYFKYISLKWELKKKNDLQP